MLLRRTALAALCGAALIAAPTLAYAQDDETGPDTVACEQANVRVEAAAAVAVAASDDLAAAQAAILAGLQGNVETAQANMDAALADFLDDTIDLGALVGTQLALQAALDALENAAEPGALTDALVAAQVGLQVAIDGRANACTAPDGGDSDGGGGEFPADEFDCPDFPLPDGRTAQDVLDADAADPNRLDRDRDGVACELDDLDGDGEDFSQVGGRAPIGGVSTGG